MLKHKKDKECSVSSIEFDEYVPFTVEFECDSMSPTLYWRCGDGKSSLMEIGLNRDTGLVQSITLTSIKPENTLKENRSYICRSLEKEGLPVFDVTRWKRGAEFDEYSNNFIDEFNLDLELLLGQNFISVLIVGGMAPVQSIRNNNVVFGVDANGSLCNIDIINMSQEDLETVGSAVRWSNRSYQSS